MKYPIYFTASAIGIIFFSILVMFCAPLRSWANADVIYKENSPAVVVVASIDGEGKPTGIGSGFIVSEDGVIVTNYHVVNMASDIKIKIGARVMNVEGLLHVDPENDIAIIKVKGKEYPKVRIGDANKAQVGEKVYVIGSPQGLENTISEGILSGLREIDRERKILQMTAAISPGSSGGPVFNSRGEVIGIATFLIAETQNLNFAMPVNLVMAGLSKTQLVSPQDACKLDFNETASCWLYQGLAYGSIGQHDRAADAFKRALDIDSKKVETYVNLGISYANMSKHQEAIDMLNQALKIDPNRAETFSKLGMVYSQMEKYDDAVINLKRSIDLKPGDPVTYFNLAVTYGKMNQYKKAIESAKEAIRLVPNFPDAHGFLGFSYTSLGMHAEAAGAYKEAIRLDPDDPRMHLGLGKAYVNLGERALALDEYKILMKVNPGMANTLFDSIYK
jgi:tetratricopeptide (TPR) repeat protein